ncbi:MAG: hypothetical protein IPI67_03350 [Myxococcales bacterium]|nr:hypothetical protein [Myxococcales bacterium]
MRSRSVNWLIGSALLLAGCGTAGVVQTALHGDLASLKREVRESREAGRLNKATVEDLAAAVAGREVRSSTGNAAVDRIKDVRPCAKPLVSVLEARAGQADDAAAQATWTLFELGRRDGDELVRKHRDASSGAWRALAARASGRKEHGPLRRKYFTDPDERVRRGALAAAIEARSVDDLDPALEAARLDPDLLSKAFATRAVGAIGGQRAVLALVDHWVRADESTRMTIIDAWAMPASYAAGGEHELTSLAENKQGLLALVAADALVRSRGRFVASGVATLLRAVKEGTEAERRLAIQLIPFSDKDAVLAIEKASADSDKEVKVIALARLAGEGSTKAKALGGLRELAKLDDDLGLQARAALAAAGDTGVKKQLTDLLTAPKARTRTVAARGLLALGDYGNAATALADDDPGVRTAVACAVLAGRD